MQNTHGNLRIVQKNTPGNLRTVWKNAPGNLRTIHKNTHGNLRIIPLTTLWLVVSFHPLEITDSVCVTSANKLTKITTSKRSKF